MLDNNVPQTSLGINLAPTVSARTMSGIREHSSRKAGRVNKRAAGCATRLVSNASDSDFTERLASLTSLAMFSRNGQKHISATEFVSTYVRRAVLNNNHLDILLTVAHPTTTNAIRAN